MMNHVRSILWKHLKDTLKNTAILIQFIMFPCMTIIMENAVKIPNMQEHFFANLFAVMYIGMAPLTSMSAIISEEKESNTLRVLRMYNMKAHSYFLGNAIYIISICMGGSLIIGIAGGYQGIALVRFMVIMLIGHVISMFVGAAIGAGCKNQMMATSLSVPIMMLASFLPMLSTFNGTIEKISKIIYTEQLYLLMNKTADSIEWVETITVLIVNVCLIAGCFSIAYRHAFKED
ncbi:MAG: ABC transporter permease [Lachnospiraceae bacterium]|nr:ABC transporter permease [Lachnospiraceae bacterium]